MKENFRNRKLTRIAALFFALMLCFTILSRAASQKSVAVVTTGRPQNMAISHRIKVSGKVAENQELAVTTEPEQRVTAIYVREGQRVEAGELLFEVDLDVLQEQILYQEQEMEKQQLQVQDAKSQKEVSAMQKANEQAQASEQYSLSVSQANVQVKRAKEDLEAVKKELKKYKKNSKTTQQDSAVEEALEKTLEEKSEAYIQAEQELSELQWKIEKAVDTALTEAEASASLSLSGSTYSQSAEILEEEPDGTAGGISEYSIVSEIELYGEESDGGSSGEEGSGSSSPQAEDSGFTVDSISQDGGASESYGQAGISEYSIVSEIELYGEEPDGSVLGQEGSGSSSPQAEDSGFTVDSINQTGGASESYDQVGGADSDIILDVEEWDMSGSQTGTGNASGAEQAGTSGVLGTEQDGAESLSGADSASGGEQAGTSGVLGMEQDGAESLSGTGSASGGGNSTVSQVDLDEIEQSVRDGYSQKLQAARKKVETALQEKEAAQAALTQYQQELLEAAGTDSKAAISQLLENQEQAQRAYEDAVIAANEAAVTGGRAVQTAGIPEASNSSDRMNEITYEQMELALEKLEKLKEADGKVYAPAAGLITEISIRTGEDTTDQRAILMADLSKGFRFTADITEEQEKYIGTGDLVTLTGSDGQSMEELPVESVAADEEDESVYRVTVQVPEDTFDIGATLTMDFTRKSETYSVVVPLSALHLDEKNQAYVLIAEEYESIMGTELRAARVDVTVAEKNETYAALESGALDSSQEIITGSDKAIDAGSRIRAGES